MAGFGSTPAKGAPSGFQTTPTSVPVSQAGGLYVGGKTPDQQWSDYYGGEARGTEAAANRAATSIGIVGNAMKSLFDSGAGSSSSSSSSGGDGSGGAVQYGGGNPALAESARSQAFAKAKDRIGALARSSITSLRNAAGSTNRLGSGRYDASERAMINSSRSGLTDVVRDQTQSELAAQQHAADTQNQNNLQAQEIASRTAASKQAAQAASMQSLMNIVLQGGALY